jgi:hypothetical protein
VPVDDDQGRRLRARSRAILSAPQSHPRQREDARSSRARSRHDACNHTLTPRVAASEPHGE